MSIKEAIKRQTSFKVSRALMELRSDLEPFMGRAKLKKLREHLEGCDLDEFNINTDELRIIEIRFAEPQHKLELCLKMLMDSKTKWFWGKQALNLLHKCINADQEKAIKRQLIEFERKFGLDSKDFDQADQKKSVGEPAKGPLAPYSPITQI